jgi:4'-phosphopantetheinyl transferase
MIGRDEWLKTASFALSPGEVHVWRASLEIGSDTLLVCRQSLSLEERARADRFHFDDHRRRFIAARGILRHLLGGYTGTAASDVQFDYGPHGKPSVRQAETTIRFNLSHSGELMVAALSSTAELGVDIEKDDRQIPATDISKRFFTPEEHAEVQQEQAEQRTGIFLRYWTAKEAVMKATGLGLSLDPAKIAIALDPLRLTSLRGEAGSGWELRAFQPATGYTGVLAFGGVLPRISFFEWATSPDPTL